MDKPKTPLDKLKQQRARLATKEQALRHKIRKAENRRKYELGGLIVKAGLKDTPNDILLGALFEIASRMEDKTSVQGWEKTGAQGISKSSSEKLGVTIRFEEPQGDDVTKILKANGLRWNRLSKQWEGFLSREQLSAVRGSVEAGAITIAED